VHGLLTDLYELTMSAGYYSAGLADQVATFELSVRRLPKNRDFLVAAGLAQAVEYVSGLGFSAAAIEYLRGLVQFSRAKPEFFEYLRGLRFTGDLFAVPEGTPVFAGEPILIVRAPLVQAQILETVLLSAIAFQTLIATKAMRIAEAAAGRAVVEFGTRRAHTPEAGVLAGRAAYIGGCIGTSNTLTGFRYGVPVYGTAAHSWVQAFPEEIEAQRRLQELLGPNTIYLVDTYDTLEGARKAASLGLPLWGVRLDSGDLALLSRGVRGVLDAAGLHDAKIMASGDLNEYKIRELVSGGAPIDAFGVGTELATSADAPALGAVYKLVEIGQRCTMKFSPEKETLPGAKQIYRSAECDLLALARESLDTGGEPLLRPVIYGGRLLESLPNVHSSRNYAAQAIARRPRTGRVERSPGLAALVASLKKGAEATTA